MSNKPLYILFVIGYPDAPYYLFAEAAKEFGVNLQVKYHGCIINTLYKDDFGLRITDASVEKLKIEEENKEAIEYYETTNGKDWLNKIRDRAFQICDERTDPDLPF